MAERSGHGGAVQEWMARGGEGRCGTEEEVARQGGAEKGMAGRRRGEGGGSGAGRGGGRHGGAGQGGGPPYCRSPSRERTWWGWGRSAAAILHGGGARRRRGRLQRGGNRRAATAAAGEASDQRTRTKPMRPWRNRCDRRRVLHTTRPYASLGSGRVARTCPGRRACDHSSAVAPLVCRRQQDEARQPQAADAVRSKKELLARR